ncbi:ParE toxin of type II toxin-antitoxin system, parDE [uncultured archaeon]|nr:ParE toxin of type II toxin-antitoxin system, parDE [uncultured archaeon]
MFEIYLSNSALKALKNFDRRIVDKTKKALLILKNSPLPIKEYDIKKVEGADDIYRMRISRYRIVYRIDWGKKEINIIKIEKRNEKTYRL